MNAMGSLQVIVLLFTATAGSMFFKRPPAKITLVDIHPANGPVEYDSEDIGYYENINPHCKTVFLVHGWYNPHIDAFEKSHEELLAKERCCNVIKVQWRVSDDMEGYYHHAKRIPGVSAYLAEHIVELHHLGLLQHLVEVVGHSMGAHIAGTAARIANRRGRQVDLILGLDPAGPGFTDYDLTFSKFKLTSKDASTVMTLYTNKNYLGSSEPMGDFVFYANDGSDQPGCDTDILCDHHKAIEYYNESQNNRVFVAYDLEGNEALFPTIQHEAPGHYYFSTRSPYAPARRFDNFEKFAAADDPRDVRDIRDMRDIRDPRERPAPLNPNVDGADFMYNRFNKYNKYIAF